MQTLSTASCRGRAFRFSPKCRQLGAPQETVEAPNRYVHEPRHAVHESASQYVELQKPVERRQYQLCGVRTFSLTIQNLRLKTCVDILLCQIRLQSLGRIMQ